MTSNNNHMTMEQLVECSEYITTPINTLDDTFVNPFQRTIQDIVYQYPDIYRTVRFQLGSLAYIVGFNTYFRKHMIPYILNVKRITKHGIVFRVERCIRFTETSPVVDQVFRNGLSLLTDLLCVGKVPKIFIDLSAHGYTYRRMIDSLEKYPKFKPLVTDIDTNLILNGSLHVFESVTNGFNRVFDECKIPLTVESRSIQIPSISLMDSVRFEHGNSIYKFGDNYIISRMSTHIDSSNASVLEVKWKPEKNDIQKQ